jgi:putative transcriptional regulator
VEGREKGLANMRLDEIVGETLRILEGHGYSVELISYPEDHKRRGIDIAASRGNRSLLIKVVEDVATLSPKDVRELRNSSKVLGVSSLIVAGSNNGSDIDSIVAIDRAGVYTVGLEGLRAALRNEIYVVHRQGNLYMRVNGAKLRKERIEKGYSLGDIASLLGVTRRSIYLYEQGKVEVSLSTALKLLEIFGDEIFEPIPVLDEPSYRSYDSIQRSLAERAQHEYSPAGKVIEEIRRVGGEAVETKRIPPDVIARVERDKMLILVERRRDRKFEKRIHEAVKVAHHVNAKVVAVVSSPEKRVVAEGYRDVTVYKNVDEAINDICKVRNEQKG